MAGTKITSNVIATDAISATHIADDAIAAAHIGDGVITTAHISSSATPTFTDLTLTGNLTVNGTTTTLNTATLDVEDKNITLNYGSGDTSSTADGAGITIQDAVDASNNATLLWDATNDRFKFSHPLHISSTGHTLYQQHRQSSGVGVGQEMKFAFNTSNGTEEVYGSIYAEIDANTDGAETGTIALRAADAGSLGYVIKGEGGGNTTLYADGDAVMTLKDGGNVGIGATDPSDNLEVASALGTIRITDTDGGYVRLRSNGGNLILQADEGASEDSSQIEFHVDGGSKAILNDGGRLVINHTSSVVQGTLEPKLQVYATNNEATLALGRFGANTSPPYVTFLKSRNSTIGSHTIINDGDNIGEIRWRPSDGNDFANECAAILAKIDGTPGTDDTPGELIFQTTTDGSGTATTKMVIKNSGKVGIGETDPDHDLHIKRSANEAVGIEIENANTGNASSAMLHLNGQGNNFWIYNHGDGVSGKSNQTEFKSTAGSSHFTFVTSSTERARINSTGLGVGTDSPQGTIHAHAASGDGYIYITGDGNHLKGGRIVGHDGGLTFQPNTGSNSTYSEAMRITTDKRVGITDTSPIANLSVGGNVNGRVGVHIWNSNTGGNSAYSQLNLGHEQGGFTGGYISHHQDGVMKVWNRNSIAMLFGVNDAESMRLDSDGRLSIGYGSSSVTQQGTGAPLFVQGRGTSSAQKTVLHLRHYQTQDQTDAMTCDIDFSLWDSNSNTGLNVPQARIGATGDDTGSQDDEAGGRLSFYVATDSYGSSTLTKRGEFVAEVGGDFYTNDGSVSSLSDVRVKTDINSLTDGLAIVKQLRPVTYKYNNNSDSRDTGQLGDADGTVRYGFIADEVQAVAPQYVKEGIGYVNNERVNDFKSLSLTRMIPMLTKALQEANAKIEALETRIETLEG